MRRSLFPFLVLSFAAGCNRNDVDSLGRIGRKVLERTQTAVSPLRDRFDHTVKGIGANGLRHRVHQRLAADKALAEMTIEVIATESDIELRGNVKTADQRRRALELAETTIGVERVTDHLQVE